MAMTRVSMRKKQAQSVLEYALVISCVVLALLTMQTYIKRSVQGKLRQSADEIGQQYNPRHTSGEHNLTVRGNSIMEVKTLSEAELTDKYGFSFDLNEDGYAGEDDVFGMTVNNTITEATTQQEGTEDVF